MAALVVKIATAAWSNIMIVLVVIIIKHAESTTTTTTDQEHPLPPFSCDSTNPSTKTYAFCNGDFPISQRAHDLVSQLTLDEKISQLVKRSSAIPRLGIPYYMWNSEALHGVASSTVADSGVYFNGTIQAATSFPQVILTAATFDAHLWYRIAKVTKQDMADTYQPPFRSCVEEGRASGIMCAYNLINGVPSCADYDLLTKTARGEWGFQGYITSDDMAVSHLYEKQNYSKSHEDAVSDALKAGVDVDCGSYLSNYTKSAVEMGKVSESDIDRALHNLFSVRMRLGLFNGNPSELMYANLTRKDVCNDEHQNMALEVARHGIVLMKNSANLLPLSKAETKSLAVIGPNANVTETLLGNYAGTPCKTITPLQGLMNYVKKIDFHTGCETINCTSIALREAVKIARSADYVVLVMGLNQDLEREALDREDLILPGEQQSLIRSVAKEAKKPIILLLLCGGPVDISFAKDDPKIGGILWAGYPGQAGGRAIAEIIFGDHNPGGRLPVTWYPNDFIKIPMSDMRMRPDASSGYLGRTYKFYEGEKVFEFGYGLSYSNYSYRFVHVSRSKLNSNLEIPGDVSAASNTGFETCNEAKLSVIVSVGNEGEMSGKHSVLLFLKRDEAVKGSPIKQLVGFETVRLNAKEKANVEFHVNPCQHFTSASEDGTLVIESGAYHLIVGDQHYPILSASHANVSLQ